MDLAYLHPFTQWSAHSGFEFPHLLRSPSSVLRCTLIRLKVMGYVSDMDTSVSLDMTVVAHLSVSSTGATSSINCQYLSFSSSVLASVSLVTEFGHWSDSTADTGHRCSVSLLNISLAEFHLVLQDWMSLWDGSCISFCFAASALFAGLLWLKCCTSLLAATMTRLM